MKYKYLYKIVIIIWIFTNALNVYAQKNPKKEICRKSKKCFRIAERNFKKEKYDDALLFYKNVDDENPTSIYTQKQIADIYYKWLPSNKKDYKKAIHYYEKAINNIEDKLKNYAGKKAKKKQYHDYKELKKKCENRRRSCYTGIKEIAPAREEYKKDLKKQKYDKSDINKNKSNYEEKPNNKINFEFEYINKEFISFKENQIVQQKNQIEKEVSDKYNENKSILDKYDYTKIQKINNEWLQQTRINKKEWRKEFKVLENKYITKIDEFNTFSIELKEKKNELSNINKEIDDFGEKRDENNKLIEEIKNLKLFDDLSLEMQTIPKSIFLIGRIELLSSSETSESKECLLDSMENMAIQKTQEYYVNNLKKLKNDNYYSKKTQVISGNAQEAARYYKDLNKHLKKKDNIDYSYQLIRYDVLPVFEKNKENKFDETNKQKKTYNFINIYEVDESQPGALKECKKNGNISFMDEHEFKSVEIKYIKDIQQISNKLNEDYKKDMENAKNNFKEKISRYNAKKNSIEKENRFFSESLSDCQKKKNKIDNEFNAKKNIKNKKEQELIEAEKKYKLYYNTKTTYANRLISIPGEQVGNMENELIKISYNTYETPNEIRTTTIKNTVYKITDKKGERKEKKSYSISYEPKIKGFQIISLGYCEDEDQKRYLVLNMGYKIEWDKTKTEKTSKEKERKQAQEAIDYAQEAQQSAKISRSSTLLNIDSNIVDNKNKLTWKIYPDEMFAYSNYKTDKEKSDMFRLPSLSELENLFKGIQSTMKSSGIDLIKENGWDEYLKYPILTSEIITENNHKLVKCLKITDNSNYQYKIESCSFSGIASAILVKKKN